MTPPADPERYKNHRFPGEIISHGVWLSYRFPLSYRDVQELLFERSIDVTHEAIARDRGGPFLCSQQAAVGCVTPHHGPAPGAKSPQVRASAAPG